MDKISSPLQQAKKLENQVNSILRQVNHSRLSLKQRGVLAQLLQNLTDVRTYTSDYELSETREEQANNAKQAKKWLKHAQKNVLAASQFNVFNAIDTAHISAQIDLITDNIK